VSSVASAVELPVMIIFDETGYYRYTLLAFTGHGDMEPTDFLDLLCAQYVDNFEYLTFFRVGSYNFTGFGFKSSRRF
jgi:hypothetical protein